MTVSSTLARVSYAGDGVTTLFAVPFRFLDASHLFVVKRSALGTETTQVLSTNYSVAGADNPAGGSVTMIAAPASGETLTIVRNVPTDQQLDYVANDPFPAESHERGLDKITMIVQQLDEQVDRAIRGPVSEAPIGVLPTAATRGDRLLGFSSLGALLLSGSTMTQIDSVVAAAYAPAASSLADTVSFLQAGDGAVARSVQARLRDRASAKDFATGNGVTDDTAKLQKAVDAANYLFFPPGDYRITDQINLKSNLTIEFAPGAQLRLGDGIINKFALRGDGLSNVRIKGYGSIVGNGLAGLSLVYLTNCTRVSVDWLKITKAGAMALLIDTCSKVSVTNCDLSENYFYGIDERQSTGNKYIGNTFHKNGNTGVATSPGPFGGGGRGINLWEASDAYVAGNSFTENTEYGFRLYSQVGDSDPIKACRVLGNYFRDNVGCDLVIYNESGLVKRHVVNGCIIERTTNPLLGAAFTIQGSDVAVSSCHIFKDGAFGTTGGFNFFQASNCSLSQSSASNLREAIGFGTSTNLSIDGFLGNGIGIVGIPLGQGVVVRNSRFVHGGGGAADVAIQNFDATGRNRYVGNSFEGFHTAIYIAGEPVSLIGNRSTGSTFTGLRKDGDVVTNQEFDGNSWDAVSPIELGSLRRTVSTGDRAHVNLLALPTRLAWSVGDLVRHADAVLGEPAEWQCVVAGIAGTGAPPTWAVCTQVGIRTVGGTPSGVLTPWFTGERAFDTTNKHFYEAVGALNTDWKQVTV